MATSSRGGRKGKKKATSSDDPPQLSFGQRLLRSVSGKQPELSISRQVDHNAETMRKMQSDLDGLYLQNSDLARLNTRLMTALTTSKAKVKLFEHENSCREALSKVEVNKEDLPRSTFEQVGVEEMHYGEERDTFEAEEEIRDIEAGNEAQRVRKQQRPWTLDEVVSVVDGVERFGVGSWKEIKRVSFEDKPYRTSVDIKDKWRNLRKAAVAPKVSGSIPPHILAKVRGLINERV